MTGRRRFKLEQQRDVAIVRGWRVQDLLREAGVRPYFAGGGWMVDNARVPDVLAHLQRRHIEVEMSGLQRAADAPPQTPASEAAAADADVPLWGADGGAA